MHQQFTEKAKKALSLATRAAGRLHQNYVGTEHILVGLIQENTGVAAKVLQENGVDAQRVIEMIKDLIAPQTDLLTKEKKGFSKKAQNVIEESHRQANRFHSKDTGTEHLLMAMIKENDNVAVRLLNTLGFQTQKLYVDVLLAMGEDANLYKEDLARHSSKQKKESTAFPSDQVGGWHFFGHFRIKFKFRTQKLSL